jgi:hypothetical protein
MALPMATDENEVVGRNMGAYEMEGMDTNEDCLRPIPAAEAAPSKP